MLQKYSQILIFLRIGLKEIQEIIPSVLKFGKICFVKFYMKIRYLSNVEMLQCL